MTVMTPQLPYNCLKSVSKSNRNKISQFPVLFILHNCNLTIVKFKTEIRSRKQDRKIALRF